MESWVIKLSKNWAIPPFDNKPNLRLLPFHRSLPPPRRLSSTSLSAMPKGAKKRAKLKKKQQEGHPDDAANHAHNVDGNGNGAGGDENAPSHRDGDGERHHQHLRIPPHVPHADVSEDSMESSEEMVTPRAAASEGDEEERKPTSEVHVERAVEVVEEDGAPGEEVMVDALPPETVEPRREGKEDAEVEVQALPQEPEVKDVVPDDAPAMQEPEVADAPVVNVREMKREVADVQMVHEPELKVEDVVVVRETPVALEPEVKDDAVVVAEKVSVPLVQEPEPKDGNVVVKESAVVSRSQDSVDVHTTEAVQGQGPAVAMAAPGQRSAWWNCCGLFDAFSGSQR